MPDPATGRPGSGGVRPPAAPITSPSATVPAPSPAAPARSAAPSRRAVLSTAALTGTLATLGATGCARREDPRPHPDVAVLLAAIAGEERLVALYEAVRRTHAGLAARIDPMLAHHREHLTALRRHYRPGTRPTPSTAPRSPDPLPSVPADEGEALAALRAAERGAARARSTEAGQVEPALAQLLASIGACEAGHDEALRRRR